MAKKTVYEIVTENVLEKLRSGELFWDNLDLSKGRPFNYFSEKEYTGINMWLLDFGGQYATYKQITEAGGTIKEDETKNWKIVTFFAPVKGKKKDDKEDKSKSKKSDEEEITGFVYRYYRVYDVVTQVEGLEPKESKFKTLYDRQVEKEPFKLAEHFCNGYFKDEDIKVSYSNEDYTTYNPLEDSISIMSKDQFENEALYYSSVFAEMGHSTGHEKRLNRKSISTFDSTEGYDDKEYLISELVSSNLMGELNIANKKSEKETKKQIDFWIKALEKDSRLISFAGSQAYKAIKYLVDDEEVELKK